MRNLRSFSGLGLMLGAILCLNAAPKPPPAPSSAPPLLPEILQKTIPSDHVSPDVRQRRLITPVRVVWQSKPEGGSVENVEHLLKPGSGQVTLSDKTACVLKHQGQPPGFLLDFGAELQGGVQIAVNSFGGPTRLRVRFGESVSEAMSEPGEKNSQNDHAVRDQTCLVPMLGTHEVGNTGFRFVRIDLVDTNKTVALKSVRAVFSYRDLEYKGSFRCNDERLNRIWLTGAYTVHLNLQDYVWDGIKRDRLVWIGDLHPETMTISAVFGDLDVVRRSLDLVRDETPPTQWMNGISSYSMWWILIHHSWYGYHGDLQYLKAQQKYLVALLNELLKYIGPDNAEILPEGRFLDWPSNENKPAIHAGLHSLLILTFKAGADLCEALNDRATKKKCLAAVERLKQHVPNPNNSKQAAALMALAELGDPVQLNREILAVDGAKRLSTFYGYYVLQARAKAGDYQGALDAIRQYWGAMLDLGATTFWEDFNLDWAENAGRIDELVPPGKKDVHGDYGAWCYKGFRHSLCHGWASGPTAWLTQHVLGVNLAEPGGKVLLIDPHLGDLQWVEGSFPTPQGIVRIRHDKQPSGKVKTLVNGPPGVKLVPGSQIEAPAAGKKARAGKK